MIDHDAPAGSSGAIFADLDLPETEHAATQARLMRALDEASRDTEAEADLQRASERLERRFRMEERAARRERIRIDLLTR